MTEREVDEYCLRYLGLPISRLGLIRWLIQGGTLREFIAMWKRMKDKK